MPKISVIMPAYNGAKHIREAIESVLAQTFTDWDLWVINEFGSNDGSAAIVAEYAAKDSRFHLIQNEERLGLADSLNKGFELAQGEYYARLDADDLAHPVRFAKQVAYMDEHPNVGICGTYQHHFGKETDWTHRPPVSPEECRVRLLFNCDLCHSTLMLRRDVVLKNKLFYDKKYLAEDFELWGRAIFVTDIANIPEVLGEYRWDGDNITVAKEQALDVESGQLVGRNLKRALGMNLTEEECELFRGWHNPLDQYSGAERDVKLKQLERLLRTIYTLNRKKRVLDKQYLLNGLACKWRWAKYHAPWDANYEIQEIDQIFRENYKPSFRIRYKYFHAHHRTFGSKLKRIIAIMLRPLARPFRRRLEAMLVGQADRICNFVEDKTWDRYLRLSEELRQTAEIIEAQQIEIKMLAAELEEYRQMLDGRVWKAEENILQTLDGRIWKAEQLINQTMDGRVWKAEQLINQTMDGRVWKAEQLINQTTDERIWKAEQLINQTMDERIWKAEQLINQTTDGRIWKAEHELSRSLNSIQWNILFDRYAADTMKEPAETKYYDFSFYVNNRYFSVESAREVLAELFLKIPHQSVVDFGCGIGSWLWVSRNLGAKEITGYDGDYVPKGLLMIPEDSFVAADLERPVKTERKYDLAVSLEVAEHLRASAADDFVKSICGSSNIILFSAAHPGQGGDGHINEQPKEYWVEKFSQNGFHAIEISKHYASNVKIEKWYRDNMVLFVKQDQAEKISKMFMDWQ